MGLEKDCASAKFERGTLLSRPSFIFFFPFSNRISADGWFGENMLTRFRVYVLLLSLLPFFSWGEVKPKQIGHINFDILTAGGEENPDFCTFIGTLAAALK